MASAVAYIKSSISAPNGEVIGRDRQVERIRQFAEENALEVIAWFEDGDCPGQDVLDRPGIRALLAFAQPYDLVICDRFGALARSMADLKPFFRALEGRGAMLEAATPMWDCLSQQCRRRSNSVPVLPLPGESSVRYRVTKPVRLNFVHLVHHAPPSTSPRL